MGVRLFAPTWSQMVGSCSMEISGTLIQTRVPSFQRTGAMWSEDIYPSFGEAVQRSDESNFFLCVA